MFEATFQHHWRGAGPEGTTSNSKLRVRYQNVLLGRPWGTQIIWTRHDQDITQAVRLEEFRRIEQQVVGLHYAGRVKRL